MADRVTHYVRVYTDADGASHFDDVEVPLEDVVYAPPAAPMEVSAAVEAERMVFVGGPAGWEGDWHPSPKRQFAFILQGIFEVGVSDGETRRFSAGQVVLLEDTSGRGHFTRITSEGPGLTPMVLLEQEGKGTPA